ncbi:MAG: hypothetical protein NT155_01080 [Candidatus Staskawiczbacteria bacterium]|nr:hypothetical protein [Candidatus Staskawiczbacteria bacterium]
MNYKKLFLLATLPTFLLFSLFFITEIAKAADTVTVTINLPTLCSDGSTPTAYKRGDCINLSGSIGTLSCSNNAGGADLALYFYIETINVAGTKSLSSLATLSPVTVHPGSSGFSGSAYIPNNAYIGMNKIVLAFQSFFWDNPQNTGPWQYYSRDIRVSDIPTPPTVAIYPTNPTSSDNLTCAITTASTTTDAYNFCYNPSSCPGSGYNIPGGIYYTYKWYKNNALQNTSSAPSPPPYTPPLTYTLTNPSAGTWRCDVIPQGATSGLVGATASSLNVIKPSP